MNKLGQFITTVVIGAFAIALIAMVVLASGRAANPVKGSFAHALEGIKHQNLTATALAPADVYGDDWVGAMVLCPGTSAEDVASQLQVDASALGFEGEVPEGTNYLAVINATGDVHTEAMEQAEVNLCAAQLPGAFDARMMVPLIQDDEGVWMLAA